MYLQRRAVPLRLLVQSGSLRPLALVQSRIDALGGDRQLEQLTPDGVGDGIRDGSGRGVVGPFPNGLRLIRSRSAAGRHEDGLEGWDVRDCRQLVVPEMAV